jgi:hypothetical protein
MKEIHITDLESFVSCRRRWDFASQLRRGLERAALSPPLFTGQGVHVGLDAYYKFGQDWKASIKTFRGWVETRAREIEKFSGPLWEQEQETIDETRTLGSMMLLHYGLWAPKRDADYEIVATEQRFNVPIPVPLEEHIGTPWKVKRQRGMWHAPGVGIADGRMSFAGRLDGIIRRKSDGALYVLEFKTARSLSNTAWIYRGIQGTAYVWAARVLFGDVRGIVYRVLRKAIPEPPATLSNPLPDGRPKFSQAKNQKTSFQFLKWWFERHANKTDGVDARQLFHENERLLRAFHARETADGNEYFEERLVHKTEAQMANVMRAVYYEGERMIDPRTAIYARGGWSNCNICPFQDPCGLMEAGHFGAAEAVLESEYAPRTYWEKNDDD